MCDQSGVGLSVMKGVWNPTRTCHFLFKPYIFEKVSLLLEAYAGLAGKIIIIWCFFKENNINYNIENVFLID